MPKRPLLNLILFLCLTLTGMSFFVETLFAVDSNCLPIRGKSTLSGGNELLDFTRLNFESIVKAQYRSCVRPVSVGKYILDGWVWNNQLGWVSTRAVADPNNPAQKLNSGIVMNSGYEYGVDIEKETFGLEQTAKLKGFMWGDNIGWIKMNCDANDRFAYDVDHCGAQNYGVEVDFKRPVGQAFPNYFYLKGYAWNQHYGYIKFDDVAVHVPELDFDFEPVVEIVDSNAVNYANGNRTDQQIVVRMFDPRDENVTDLFVDSGFGFCLIFEDQRTFDGLTLVDERDFNLAVNECDNHVEFDLNAYDSRTAFEFNSDLGALILKGVFYPRSFVTTEMGDLKLSAIKMFSNDPAIPAVKIPVEGQFLTFESPLEVALVPVDMIEGEISVDAVLDLDVDSVEFDYGAGVEDGEDFILVSRFHRGELLNESLGHKINFSFSDEDLVDVSLTLQLSNLDGESQEDEPFEEINVEVPDLGLERYSPLFEIGSAYDLENDLVVPVNIQLEKVNAAVPNEILATNIFIDSKYSFDFVTQDGTDETTEVNIESVRIRTNEFETFETFTKGFLQDRAFNSVFDESREAGSSNYALFRAKLNQIMQSGNMRVCSLSSVNSGECGSAGENEIIFIEKQDVDLNVLRLRSLYESLDSLTESPFVVITSGFDFYVDDDFVRGDSDKFGLVALQNKRLKGGRMMVDLDVNNIVNTFVYLDKNFMSVDDIAEAILVSNEDSSAAAGIPSFADSDAFNQLVFSGQLISNNCVGCSRATSDKPSQRADGRLVLEEDPNSMVEAQLDDINFVRYSPLVFNLDREEGDLYELDCDGNRVNNGQRINVNTFFADFSLDQMCYDPERLGLDVSRSAFLQEASVNKLRSFMMFYQDPGSLPVFGLE